MNDENASEQAKSDFTMEEEEFLYHRGSYSNILADTYTCMNWGVCLDGV